MAIRQDNVKIRVYYDKAVITDQEIQSGDLLEAIIAKLIAKDLALRRDVESQDEKIDGLENEVIEKIGDIKMFVGAYPADSKDQPNLTNGIVHLILDTLGKQENRSWMKIYGKDGIEVTTDEDTNIVISGNGSGGGNSAITTEEIDEACDYLPVDDSGIKPLTDEQIDEICTV